jgi:hypothetical protein
LCVVSHIMCMVSNVQITWYAAHYHHTGTAEQSHGKRK